MQDLTAGSISKHLIATTSYMLVTMIFQTLYFLIDLYWVGRLGTDAVAAVAIAGNLTFIVLALTQMLGVGTTAVVSHAAGRKNRDEAQHLFNQSQVLAITTGVLFLIVGMALRTWYCNVMAADAETARLAGQYLAVFIPAMALQFALVAMGSALRAIGIFKPGMIISTATVVLNMVLAPFLIFGWVTGRAFGVAGAAWSSFIAIVVGIVWFAWYFLPKAAYLHFKVEQWHPNFGVWKRMLVIGLPAGFEFALMAVYQAVVYTVARPFGSAAQAGFGIGMRVIQAGFMPVVALGFAVAPVAGQNFGAKLAERVKRTFKDAAYMSIGATLIFATVVFVWGVPIVGAFSKDPAVIAVSVEYLRIISYNYVASGLIFVASSMFQAMGNTIPSLVASAVRIVIVAVPAILLARLPSFQLHWVWYLSATAVWIQLGIAMSYLRREFRTRLAFGAASSHATGAALTAEAVG
jgi:putative MATE family efflux protein